MERKTFSGLAATGVAGIPQTGGKPLSANGMRRSNRNRNRAFLAEKAALLRGFRKKFGVTSGATPLSDAQIYEAVDAMDKLRLKWFR